MNKCPKCGKEFEGNFCPNCGTRCQGASTTATAKKTSFGVWFKAHRKIIIPLLIAVALIIILSCSIPACIKSQDNGTYYKVKYNGEIDKETYFVLKSGKWTDEDGESGKYKKDGDKIVFYYTFFGETEEIASGTIKDSVLNLDNDIYISDNHIHRYGEWETTREATCTIDGMQTRTCACSIKETQEIKCIGHHTGEWITSKEATCTEEGSHYINCIACKQTVTEDIDKVPHTLSDWAFDNYNHWKTCSVCSEKIDDEEHKGENKCTICTYPLVDTVGLDYALNSSGDGYIVTGIGTVKDKIIRIPEKYEGLAVIAIANEAFADCNIFSIITIPNSIESIGDCAFMFCSSLTEIVIPDSVTTIGGGVFYGCSNLKNVKLGSGIKTLDTWVRDIHRRYGFFGGCSELTNLIISDNIISIGDTFGGCDSLNYNEYDNALYLGNENNPYVVLVKASNTEITNCNINSNTRIIHHEAFYKCSELVSINIPDSVTKIGVYAFGHCSGLKNISIGKGVKFIEGGAFDNCTNLEYLYFNAENCENLKKVENFRYAGKNAEGLTVTIGSDVTRIPEDLFYDDNGSERPLITSIIFEENSKIEIISSCAFYHCNFTSIIIPDRVTTIGVNAFGWGRLKSITIPSSITTIENYAFNYCNSLADIIFEGTKAQWDAINKGSLWKYGWHASNLDNCTVHCTDGDIIIRR